MPVLTNPKHERFAQELAKGVSANRAYVVAGYTEHRSNAAGLARKAHIVARVTELHAAVAEVERSATTKAADALSIDKQWVMARLMENVAKGQALDDLAPANRALELLGKELGMFIDRKEVRVGALDKLNADERDRVRDTVRRELERRLGGGGASGEPRPDQSVSALH